ncbi:hypothetical protein [Nonomuraea cypriaca]|nr:hypothetical protein [Nonomuraea cypriaca]
MLVTRPPLDDDQVKPWMKIAALVLLYALGAAVLIWAASYLVNYL